MRGMGSADRAQEYRLAVRRWRDELRETPSPTHERAALETWCGADPAGDYEGYGALRVLDDHLPGVHRPGRPAVCEQCSEYGAQSPVDWPCEYVEDIRRVLVNGRRWAP